MFPFSGKDLREEFLKELRYLTENLHDLGMEYLVVRKQSEHGIIVKIYHPRDSAFNIKISVDDEINISFFENYFTFEITPYTKKTPQQVINAAFYFVNALLNAEKIILTKWIKRRTVFKKTLEVTRSSGTGAVLMENYYFSFSCLLFFLPTRKKVITTSFTEARDEVPAFMR